MRGLALVLFALAAARIAPFQAFLFAFCLLGPLHYLTEIAWLAGRRFFVSSRVAVGVLIGLGLGGSALVAALDLGLRATWIPEAAVGALVAATTVALAAVAGLGAGAITIATVAAFVANGVAFRSPLASAWTLGFGVLLPSLVHVVAFTATFMFQGWRRTRRPAELATLVVFLLAPGVLLWRPAPPGEIPAAWETTIGFLAPVLEDLGVPGGTVPGLLAFGYLHHFLNWFDKTERVGWHRLPRRRLVGIGAAWLVCVAAYAWNPRIGLLVALVPNVLHVVLELPLNWRTLHPGPARG